MFPWFVYSEDDAEELTRRVPSRVKVGGFVHMTRRSKLIDCLHCRLIDMRVVCSIELELQNCICHLCKIEDGGPAASSKQELTWTTSPEAQRNTHDALGSAFHLS